jgi:hypothetical protein
MRRRAFIAGLVLVAVGVAALVATVLLPNRTNALDTPISDVPAQMVEDDPAAPVDPEAIEIGRKFLLTAVVRKQLDWAYDHVHVDLKGRMTRAEWDTGNIPVIPFDAQNVSTTVFIPVFHLRVEVEFEIALVPKVHAVYAGTKPLQFYIALRREGDRPGGRWLVSYFEPNWRPPIRLRRGGVFGGN